MHNHEVFTLKMKVRSAIKTMCPHCFMVKRGKVRYVYCKKTPKHKQRQGYHTWTNSSSTFSIQSNTFSFSRCFFSSELANVPYIFGRSINAAAELDELKPRQRTYFPLVGISSVISNNFDSDTKT